jgi:galactose mutarotase-like enzyme
MPNPSDWLQLRSEGWTAEIDPQGAQLSVLRDPLGNDLLWNGDPTVWKGRAPILFPIVGALNDGHLRWRGQRYPLPRHGFARDRRFEVLRHDDREALLRLTADAQTLAVYPFRFELDLAFRLEGARLTIEAIVRNVGDEPMHASVGFHPAFRWPLPARRGGGQPRGEHYLEFEFEEPAPIRRLDAKGLLTPERHATPVRGRRLLLDDALFTDDVVIFDALRSRRVVFGTASGPRIAVGFPEVSHLGLWSKPGAGFVCIEPWLGVADPAGFEGEFSDKPAVFGVAPGAQRSLQMKFESLAGS